MYLCSSCKQCHRQFSRCMSICQSVFLRTIACLLGIRLVNILGALDLYKSIMFTCLVGAYIMLRYCCLFVYHRTEKTKLTYSRDIRGVILLTQDCVQSLAQSLTPHDIELKLKQTCTVEILR